MSEESPRETPGGRSFEERVFARFDALDARFDALDARIGSLESRMDALEEKVDRRLQETRPMWEAVKEQLERLNSKVGILIQDLYEMKTDIVRLDKRVSRLEAQQQTQ